MYTHHIKPVLDFVISFLGILFLGPIFMLIITVLFFVHLDNPFFFQKRLGKNGKIFKIIKFKTMNNNRDSKGNLLPDEKRITEFGKFMRRSSLDEIPQLINVILGEMSLVGPRPLLPNYLELYDNFQIRRNEVKPGITGWAQVNGRNAISWKKKFEYDVWYVDNISFFLDFKILILTIKKVFKSEGITQQGHVTSEEFKGNKL